MTTDFTPLKTRFGDQLVTKQAILDQHAGGEGFTVAYPPDAVLFVTSTQDVADAIVFCAKHAVPVIPFGAGTSLEGQVQAVNGGLCIDMSEMCKVIAVNPEDLDCRVEAGVTREQLNLEIRDQGLFFPPDPGANATLGGMASTRASGTNAMRYGTMRELTLGLTVVTPQGKVIRTGGRARKSSAGFDLTKLYIGSEGTLGVITELQVRLFGVPETIAAASVQFPELANATQAVQLILQLGIPMARIELLDALQMKACIAYSKLDAFEEKPTLFLEFHGSPAGVADQIAQIESLLIDFDAGPFRWATATEERTALWTARHNAYWAARALAPGKESFATDACVPISQLADCIEACQKHANASGLLTPIVGHVGDGNFHMLVLHDPNNPNERMRAEALSEQVAREALARGGTCTGEHGIGLHKRGLLREEHGDAVDLMAIIKAALDPQGIMNPGKII
ncbi:FAD-binding oxidoreductase [Sphingorhabdus sp.]|uniref:FAD-binding oxidoreductase n=1 Tax=Sphingorhabdus sp. TaxID=1902408 RepID=UPI004053F2A8